MSDIFSLPRLDISNILDPFAQLKTLNIAQLQELAKTYSTASAALTASGLRWQWATIGLALTAGVFGSIMLASHFVYKNSEEETDLYVLLSLIFLTCIVFSGILWTVRYYEMISANQWHQRCITLIKQRP